MSASATSTLPQVPVNFGMTVRYPVGPSPQAVASADLNNDGHLDLAVTVRTGGSHDQVAVLLGRGNGRFGAPSFFPVGKGAGYLAARDVNRDGNADLFVDNETTSTVSELLGDGHGGFSAQPEIPLFQHATDPLGTITFGDLPFKDGTVRPRDGNLDVMVASPTGLWVAFGDGQGGFSDGRLSPTRQFNLWDGQPGGIGTVAVGDLEGDGVDDVVRTTSNDIYQGGAQGLQVSHGTALDNGVYPASWPTPPQSIALADLNNDGLLDVVGQADGQLTTMTCTIERDFAGNPFCQYWTPQYTALGPAGNGRVAIGDFNADGHPDVLAGLDVLPGDNFGDFAPPAARINYPAGNDSFPAAGDFDEDGHTDVAFVNPKLDSNVSVILSLSVDNLNDLETIWRGLYKTTPMQTERGAFWKQRAVDALDWVINDPDCWTATGGLVVSTKGLLCLQRLLIANNRLTFGDRTEVLPTGETFVVRISQLIGEIARARFNAVFGVNGVHGISTAQRAAWWKAEYHLNHGDANPDRVHAALSYVAAWRILLTAGPEG